jgi:hypothetical protein
MYIVTNKGVGMIRAEIGLKNRQIINETIAFIVIADFILSTLGYQHKSK